MTLRSWLDASIDEAAAGLRSGEVSSRALVEACLDRLAAREPALNAFILTSAESARAAADEADAEMRGGRWRGPLHGLPISVKDLIDVDGLPTTAASRVRSGHRAAADAPVIRALRHAGAIIVGKTNLHEFAYGTTSEESAYGPVHHPRDPSRSAGGSSGGSAAAVAAGIGFASIGTDTGGSIRIPAAACGVVGLKPTWNELATGGVAPLCRSFDTVGPIARSVGDAWIVYRAMAGDAMTIPLAAQDPARIHLGVPRRYFFDQLDHGIDAAIGEAFERLGAAGVQLVDVDIAHADRTVGVYMPIVFAEAAAYHASTVEARPQDYTSPVRLRIEAGRYLLAEDYVRAMRGRDVLSAAVDHALDGVDALALPTLPIPAPPLGAAVVDVGGQPVTVRSVMLRLTQLFNMTGHPAVSLPGGRTREGLPAGLQLVGRRHETAALMVLALACERTLAGGSC